LTKQNKKKLLRLMKECEHEMVPTTCRASGHRRAGESARKETTTTIEKIKTRDHGSHEVNRRD
jgi:hypothetical protein